MVDTLRYLIIDLRRGTNYIASLWQDNYIASLWQDLLENTDPERIDTIAAVREKQRQESKMETPVTKRPIPPPKKRHEHPIGTLTSSLPGPVPWDLGGPGFVSINDTIRTEPTEPRLVYSNQTNRTTSSLASP